MSEIAVTVETPDEPPADDTPDVVVVDAPAEQMPLDPTAVELVRESVEARAAVESAVETASDAENTAAAAIAVAEDAAATADLAAEVAIETAVAESIEDTPPDRPHWAFRPWRELFNRD